MKLQIRKIGNSYGVIFPKEIIKNLNVDEGDALFALEEDGSVTLTPYDPEFDKVMSSYSQFSRKYRNALRELAK